jgi:hypothetical protein
MYRVQLILVGKTRYYFNPKFYGPVYGPSRSNFAESLFQRCRSEVSLRRGSRNVRFDSYLGLVCYSQKYHFFRTVVQRANNRYSYVINTLSLFRFKRENEDKLENNQKARFASAIIQNWLGLRLQMIGVLVVAGVGVVALVQHHHQMANPGE